jgi:hypothetical protein
MSEGLISSDSIEKMMNGDELIMRIESTNSICVVDQEPMMYLIKTRMCNSCWFSFNIMDSNVVGCTTICQMVYCAKNREGEPSERQQLESIVVSILNKLKRIDIENNKLRLVSSIGSEIVLE